MNVSRRHLLAATSVLPVGYAVAGCSSSAVAPKDVIDKAVTVVNGLDDMFRAFRAQYPGLLTDALYAQVEDAVSKAVDVASRLSASLPMVTATDAAGLVNLIVAYVTAALSAVAPLAALIPPPYMAAIQAAQFLLPVLAAFVTQYLPDAPKPAALRFGARPGMTEADALTILSGWAASSH